MKFVNTKTGQKFNLAQQPRGSGFIQIDRSKPKQLRPAVAKGKTKNYG